MKIGVQYKNKATIITLRGSVTTAAASTLETALVGEPKGSGGIVIDAAELEYLSDAGVKVLLSARRRCCGKPFRIIHASKEISDIFSGIKGPETAGEELPRP